MTPRRQSQRVFTGAPYLSNSRADEEKKSDVRGNLQSSCPYHHNVQLNIEPEQSFDPKNSVSAIHTHVQLGEGRKSLAPKLHDWIPQLLIVVNKVLVKHTSF